MAENKTESQVQFTEDEMEKLKKIRDGYLSVQHQFGQVSITEIRLDSQLDALGETKENLTKNFKSIQDDEKNFLDEINDKYGEGELDPETGVFISNK
jgi:hypothetical protein